MVIESNEVMIEARYQLPTDVASGTNNPSEEVVLGPDQLIMLEKFDVLS